MARLPAGQSMWIAYPDGIERVEIVEKGTGGRRYRDKANKPQDPYLVENDDESFVVASADLFDSPVAASCRRAELCKNIGIEMNDPRLSNPSDETEEDESDEEDLEDEETPEEDLEDEEEENSDEFEEED